MAVEALSSTGDRRADGRRRPRSKPARDDSEYALILRGEADLATAPFLAQALAEASERAHRRIVLDLEALDFIDAHCLGIVAAARRALRGRSELVLRAPSPMVLRLLASCTGTYPSTHPDPGRTPNPRRVATST